MLLPEFLKTSKNTYLNQSKLVNLSFSLGTFPEIVKPTKVISIFTKGDQKYCNNCRPISLLSNIRKIIEKLVHQQLYGFLEINNFIYISVYFRNQHSRNHALTTIIEKMKCALDNGKIAYRVFLGLQKACLDHDYQIFIAKLEHYGILDIPLNLFSSYLTKCYQFVEINNVQSEMLFI